jgi:hypothetical protein
VISPYPNTSGLTKEFDLSEYAQYWRARLPWRLPRWRQTDSAYQALGRFYLTLQQRQAQ